MPDTRVPEKLKKIDVKRAHRKPFGVPFPYYIKSDPLVPGVWYRVPQAATCCCSFDSMCVFGTAPMI